MYWTVQRNLRRGHDRAPTVCIGREHQPLTRSSCLARALTMGANSKPPDGECDFCESSVSEAAKEWAISADQNEPGRHEWMAMKMSPAPQS